MHRFALLLLIALLASTGLSRPGMADPVLRVAAMDPAVSFNSPARLETPEERGAATVEDDVPLVSRQTLIGIAALGGAFTIGLLASGSLSGALGAAGVVAISYAVMP